MTCVLVIGAGLLQLPAFETARRRGIRTVAVDRDPAAPGMSLADIAYAVDTRDVPGVLAVARRERVDGVVTLCTDAPVKVVAEVAAALGLRAIRPSAALAATNKILMREALHAAGVSIPRFRSVRSIGESREAANEIGLPVILKPPASSGSRGIFKVSAMEFLEEGYRHAKGVAGSEEAVLVEEFIDGPEVSVETLSFGGRHTVVAVTDKRTTGDPYWVETGHSQPSRLPDSVRSAIEECSLAALEAVGVDDAAGHVEIKVGRSGPRLIELGARLGGDFITTELVPRSTGVDLVSGILDVALGVPPDLRPTRSRGVAIRYLDAPAGTLVGVRGVDAARLAEGVVRLRILPQAGTLLAGVRSSLDRPGFIICEGADASQAEQRAAAAARMITFEVV